jgi:hypothetical protein
MYTLLSFVFGISDCHSLPQISSVPLWLTVASAMFDFVVADSITTASRAIDHYCPHPQEMQDSTSGGVVQTPPGAPAWLPPPKPAQWPQLLAITTNPNTSQQTHVNTKTIGRNLVHHLQAGGFCILETQSCSPLTSWRFLYIGEAKTESTIFLGS